MTLLKIGDLVLNLDQVRSIQRFGPRLVLHSLPASAEDTQAVRVFDDDEAADLWAWLERHSADASSERRLREFDRAFDAAVGRDRRWLDLSVHTRLTARSGKRPRCASGAKRRMAGAPLRYSTATRPARPARRSWTSWAE